MALHDEVLPRLAPPSKSTCLSQRQVLGSPVSLFWIPREPRPHLRLGPSLNATLEIFEILFSVVH